MFETASELVRAGRGDPGLNAVAVDRVPAALRLLRPREVAIGSHCSDARFVARMSSCGEPGLRDELLAMLEEDQAERTGNAMIWNDRTHAERLAEITDEHGSTRLRWTARGELAAQGASAS